MIRPLTILVVLSGCAQGFVFGQALPTAEQPPPPPAQALARTPQAKSEQERKDFNSAYSVKGGVASETAANNFAIKYPDSELREYLYSQAMHEYQAQNNPPKMLAMAQKTLAVQPDHVVALVLTATALADSLEDGDGDRARKIEEIKRSANRAIQNLGRAFLPALSGSPDQQAVYRTTLQAMAYSALGLMELKTGDDTKAEKDFTMSVALTKIEPDPYTWYHLALAQDHRKRYSAALNSVEQALQLASSNPELQRLAEIEHDRLSGLAGRAPRQGSTGTEPPQ